MIKCAFSHIKSTPELKRSNVRVIPAGKKKKDNNPDHHQREQTMGSGGRSGIGDTRDSVQGMATKRLYEKEINGDVEVKDHDDVSTDLSSSGSCILMVLSETEVVDVEVKTDNGIKVYSVADENCQFPEQIMKEGTVHYAQFESDFRKATPPTVSQPQSGPPKFHVIKRSVPQIIQVTSVEKSKTKYSYQYSGNYYGQLERPGGRMNNKPTVGAAELSQDDIIPYHGARRGGLIQVVPKENTSSYSYKAAIPPAEPQVRKPTPGVTASSKEVKDNFADLVIKEVVNSHLDGAISFGKADENDEAVHNRLTTPERDRRNRPKSSYSIRNTGRNNVDPPLLEPNENSNFSGSHADKFRDHDVTRNMTSNKASKVLGLELVPPVISYRKLVSEESNILVDGSLPRLGSKKKSTNLLRGMGSRPLPEWSRFLPL